MKKVKKFYSLKSFRKDKAIAKRFGDYMKSIIDCGNRYRESLEIIKTHYSAIL